MSTPIFVVGSWRRSGTTWLASLVSQNRQVASVQGGQKGDMGGCVESYFFSHLYGKFGDLKDLNNLVHLIEVFGNSSYFDLSGLDKDLLYKQADFTYAGIFRETMEEFARTKEAYFWLEKNPSHAFYLKEILYHYNDSKFISVERPVQDQIRSAMKMNTLEGKKPSIGKNLLYELKEIIMYNCTLKHIHHFKKHNPNKIYILQYNALLNNKRDTLESVCQFLGLEFEEEMLESPYLPQSSFQSQKEKLVVLSKGKKIYIQGFNSICKLVPYTAYRWLYKIASKLRGLHFPMWFFSTRFERIQK